MEPIIGVFRGVVRFKYNQMIRRLPISIFGMVHNQVHQPIVGVGSQILTSALKNYRSGQITATSHDRFPPNGGLVREIPLFQGNLGW